MKSLPLVIHLQQRREGLAFLLVKYIATTIFQNLKPRCERDRPYNHKVLEETTNEDVYKLLEFNSCMLSFAND